MAEIMLGNQYNFLRHVVTLESIGQVAVTVGRGVVVGIGTADRGPAMRPYGIAASAAGKIKKTYYAGPLKEGLESAADQGCSIVYGVRVMGSGFATASKDLVDDQDEGVGTLNATGPGVSGNVPTFMIGHGDLHKTIVESFAGNGGTTPYALMYNDIYESTINYVEVAGLRRTIVYTGTPDPGEALIDKATGQLSFAASEWPTISQKVEVRYKYHSRKITITDIDAGTQPIVYNNITSLTMMAARMKDNALMTFEPEVGATHLPEVMAGPANLTGGLDGDPITEDDWEAAFTSVIEDLPESVFPSAVFATAYGIEEGQYEIIGLMDAFLTKMANKPVGKMSPCQGFITLDQTATAEELTDLVAGYNNLFMTLISNGFDETEKNIAGARAGQEAALRLGTSPAVDDNSLKGIQGLLFQWSEADREVLNAAGLEVLIKETGVHPYVGVTTNLDDSFYRTVDVRTICAVIIIVDQIVKKFMNERRTASNLARMKTSIDVLLNKYLTMGVLDTYTLSVSPTESDHNAVDIALKIQPVGHIERVQTWLGVGYYDTAAIAEA